MYSWRNSLLSISQSRCTQNEAEFGGCLHAAFTTHTTISESFFESNNATEDGGAIGLHNNSTVSISDAFLKGKTLREHDLVQREVLMICIVTC